jgi:hypothetical protein
MYFGPDGAHVRPRYVKGTDVVLHANPKRGKKYGFSATLHCVPKTDETGPSDGTICGSTA